MAFFSPLHTAICEKEIAGYKSSAGQVGKLILGCQLQTTLKYIAFCPEPIVVLEAEDGIHNDG